MIKTWGGLTSKRSGTVVAVAAMAATRWVGALFGAWLGVVALAVNAFIRIRLLSIRCGDRMAASG